MLLFQDLAFVPLLALASVLCAATRDSPARRRWRVAWWRWVLLALAAVLAIGRWLLRPLLHEIAHSRLRELFTLAVLLVYWPPAWITQRLGLSMALGAFLAGMLLAETEYRHQIDAAIRPFRELLLGLFFISVGMLLDLRVLFGRFRRDRRPAGAAADRQGDADGVDLRRSASVASRRCVRAWCSPGAVSSASRC